jgi:hypothetical protein
MRIRLAVLVLVGKSTSHLGLRKRRQRYTREPPNVEMIFLAVFSRL